MPKGQIKIFSDLRYNKDMDIWIFAILTTASFLIILLAKYGSDKENKYMNECKCNNCSCKKPD